MSARTFPIPYPTRINNADEALLQDIILSNRLRADQKGPYKESSLIDQPVGSRPFLEQGSVPYSSLAPSTDYTLISFRAPRGFRGVLSNISNWVSVGGFPEGQGVLTWRYALGDGWLFEYGTVLYTIQPDLTGAMVGRGGMIIMPNQTLSVTLTTGPDLSTLDPNSVVCARLKGWYVPDVP